MHLGLLWAFVFCLETISGLSLQQARAANQEELRLLQLARPQLTKAGFSIIGSNNRLINSLTSQYIAEFDFIASDAKGFLSLIDLKHKIDVEKRKVTRQFERYRGFLKIQSPFLEPVKRVIIISWPVPDWFAKKWRERGLEFFPIRGDRVIIEGK